MHCLIKTCIASASKKMVKGGFWGVFVHHLLVDFFGSHKFLLSLCRYSLGVSGEILVLKITLFGDIQRGGWLLLLLCFVVFFFGSNFAWGFWFWMRWTMVAAVRVCGLYFWIVYSFSLFIIVPCLVPTYFFTSVSGRQDWQALAWLGWEPSRHSPGEGGS